MAANLPEEKIAEIRTVFAECGNKAETARRCGVARAAVIRYAKAIQPIDDEGVQSERRDTEGDDGNSHHIDLSSDVQIRTQEDAIRHAEVDLSIWRVKRWSCTAWQVGMKIRRFDPTSGKVVGETPTKKSLWRVSIDLERLAPKAIQDATASIMAEMRLYSPKYPKLGSLKPIAAPHLWEIDLFDVHFGKLAWGAETGQDYDLAIAEQVYRNAVLDLLQKAQGFPCDRILFPLGNDLCHIDNQNSATTKGTRVDSDSRYCKVIATVRKSLIWAVELLSQHAPVDVLWIPGNHDQLASYHLADVVSAWFRHSDRVNVNLDPSPRKYYTYGDNLIGFTHGDKENPKALTGIMLAEAAGLIRAGQHREFHLGHRHRSQVFHTPKVNEDEGLTLRYLTSLTASDAWHHENGYVGSRRAAEVFVWGRTGGLTGNFYVNTREADQKSVKVA